MCPWDYVYLITTYQPTQFIVHNLICFLFCFPLRLSTPQYPPPAAAPTATLPSGNGSIHCATYGESSDAAPYRQRTVRPASSVRKPPAQPTSTSPRPGVPRPMRRYRAPATRSRFATSPARHRVLPRAGPVGTSSAKPTGCATPMI